MDTLRDNKKIVMMAVIGVIALITAISIIKPSGGGGDKVAKEDPIAVFSLVDISEGDSITEEMLDTREPKGDELDKNYIKDINEVIGSKVLSAIEEGELINLDDLKTPAVDNGPNMGHGSSGMDYDSDLASMVPEGLRAVLMPTGDIQEMVKFLAVGNRIDLVVTHKTGDGLETTTPFQNVEVLVINDSEPVAVAVDGVEDSDEEGEAESVMVGGTSVILAMSPEQAESILNMRLSGVLETIQITLRSAEVLEND